MRRILLTGACIMLWAVPALACRGTAEYPEVAAQLTKADLPDDQKATLAKRLEEGEELHRQGHDLNDKEKRQDSLRILDEIRAEIAN